MSKVTRSHTTFIESKYLKQVLDILDDSSNVKSYTAGIILVKDRSSKVETKPKIKVTAKGMYIKIFSKSAAQEIWVYGNNLDKAQRQIESELC
jgi:hypothetical protein